MALLIWSGQNYVGAVGGDGEACPLSISPGPHLAALVQNELFRSLAPLFMM